MIEVKELSKVYKAKNNEDFYALKNINLSLKDGEVVSLLGHNGAGKTTLIKCLSSLLYPSEGSIEFNGVDIYKNIRVYRKQISYLLGGERGLYNRLTGRENIQYLSALKGIFSKGIKEEIEKYFDELGILPFIDERVETYSRGMKQKVHLINALISQSNIIFLDEPTSGMDPISSNQTRNFIKKIAKSENKTILITSHMMNEVEELSDRIMVFFKGRKEFDGDINYFKSLMTDGVSCNCRIVKNDKNIKLLEALKIKNKDNIEFKNQNSDEINLYIYGCSSEEIIEKYIKYIADSIIDINFEKNNLEKTYINYITKLEMRINTAN